ncbi:MAG: hypothetical protein LGB78_01180, partial [Sulfurovum sp.]|nr:hypothetical protein [Sulfurovum sp.]
KASATLWRITVLKSLPVFVGSTGHASQSLKKLRYRAADMLTFCFASRSKGSNLAQFCVEGT